MTTRHFVAYVEDGVWRGPNACLSCGKWFPPYKAGVPVEVVDEYCWGHAQPTEDDDELIDCAECETGKYAPDP